MSRENSGKKCHEGTDVENKCQEIADAEQEPKMDAMPEVTTKLGFQGSPATVARQPIRRFPGAGCEHGRRPGG